MQIPPRLRTLLRDARRCALAASFLLAIGGCGYHRVGSATHIPGNVRILAIPVFATRAQAYHTEMALTQAVVREFNTRTRYRIVTSDSPAADAVLRGTVLTQTSLPLTYDSISGETSSYLVTVTAKVILSARDGRVLYQNDAFSYREQYQSTQDISSSIREDPAAVNRLARDFAQALVGDMLESF